MESKLVGKVVVCEDSVLPQAGDYFMTYYESKRSKCIVQEKLLSVLE